MKPDTTTREIFCALCFTDIETGFCHCHVNKKTNSYAFICRECTNSSWFHNIIDDHTSDDRLVDWEAAHRDTRNMARISRTILRVGWSL